MHIQQNGIEMKSLSMQSASQIAKLGKIEYKTHVAVGINFIGVKEGRNDIVAFIG